MSDESAKPAVPWWKRKRFGGSFLLVSVVLHVVFGLGATYLVVQRIAAKRALAFQGGPPNPSKSQRQVEHRVAVAKQKQQSSAPAPPKRVAVAGLAKVSLPEMPQVPVASANLAVAKLGGMGGSGGFGLGPGTMGAAGGTGSAGGGVPMFGLREAGSGALTGIFYDLKQTAGRQPTDMNNDKWKAFVQQWVKGSWNEGELKRYYAAPQKLYAPFIFVPIINADEGPKAFSVQQLVQPRLWLAHYRGKVVPAASGRYRFAGYGDDILIIRFNGQVVLNQHDPAVQAHPPVQYAYAGLGDRGPRAGRWFEVTGGSAYDMEVLLGECPGGLMHAYALLERDGATHDKDPAGLPILPIFRLSAAVPAGLPPAGVPRPPGQGHGDLLGRYPPFSAKEAPWSLAKSSGFPR